MFAQQARLWAEFYPRGTVGYDDRGLNRLPTNTLVHRTVMLNAAYPSVNWHTKPPTGSPPSVSNRWTPNLGEAAANPDDVPDRVNQPVAYTQLIGRRLALEVLCRGFVRGQGAAENDTHPDLAINLIRVGIPRPELRTTAVVVTGGGGTEHLPKNPGDGNGTGDPNPNNQIVFPSLYDWRPTDPTQLRRLANDIPRARPAKPTAAPAAVSPQVNQTEPAPPNVTHNHAPPRHGIECSILIP